MAEWIQTHEFEDVPYEVAMAALEAQTAVEEWTEARALQPPSSTGGTE
jgi:hypothetical protein